MQKVSIALATYNGETYIREQLDSLATQTRLPDELVVSDDGSDDQTLPIVESFAKIAPFSVNIRRNDVRLGYRANFMQAVQACKFDLIALCDQDDVWADNKIEVLLAALTAPDVLLAYHNAQIVTQAKEPINLYWPPAISRQVARGQLPSPWFFPPGFAIIFHKSLLNFSDLWYRSLDPHDPEHLMAHDQWLFFLACTIGEIAFVDEPLALYRQHGGNACGRSPFRFSAIWENLATSARIYSWHKKAAENRIELLTSLRDRFEEPRLIERIALTIKSFEALAERLEIRTKLYRSDRVIERIRAMRNIAREGGYKQDWMWSFGSNGFVKDFVFAVPFGPRLSEIGPRLSESASEPRRP